MGTPWLRVDADCLESMLAHGERTPSITNQRVYVLEKLVDQ